MKVIFPKYCFLRAYQLPTLYMTQCHVSFAQVVCLPDAPFPFEYPFDQVESPYCAFARYVTTLSYYLTGFVLLNRNFGRLRHYGTN